MIKLGDINKITADAIVNAGNPSLMGCKGIDHRSGRAEMPEECRK